MTEAVLIELKNTREVVNCPLTSPDELMAVDSCRRCKQFIQKSPDEVFCYQPKKLKIYKAGELPKEE